MGPYVFFLDIDGTIFDGDILPERNVRAIRKAREQGHLFFLNTGRGLAHVPAAVRDKIRFDGAVCALGTYVRVGSEVLLNVPMPPHAVRRCAEMMLEHPSGGRLQGERYIFHVGKPGEDGLQLHRTEDLERYPDFVCNKFTFDGHPPEAWLEELETDYRIYRFPQYVEGGTRGYDKATGMLLVLKRLGIGTDRAVAVGDSGNDEPMLRCAGTAVVPENGEADMKAAADILIGPCLQGGLGRFLEEFLNLGP